MSKKLPKENLKKVSGARGNIEGTHPTPGKNPPMKEPQKLPISGNYAPLGPSIPHGTGPKEKT